MSRIKFLHATKSLGEKTISRGNLKSTNMARTNPLKYLQTKTGFNRLAKREKLVVGGGIVFVIGFIFFVGLLNPYFEARDKLQRSMQRKQQEVLDMAILQQEYRDLKDRQGGVLEQLAIRDPKFSLFSFLEQQASDVKVKDRVTYMKPSSTELDDGLRESVVEMKMEEVTLPQLVEFLQKIESTQNVVVIKRIAIQRNRRTQDLLDVVIAIFTLEQKLS
jgi:general secretion pathway protein M